MTMDFNIPRDFIKTNTGGIHTFTHSPMDLMIPLSKEKTWPLYHLKKTEDKFPGHLQELYWHAMRVHPYEA